MLIAFSLCEGKGAFGSTKLAKSSSTVENENVTQTFDFKPFKSSGSIAASFSFFRMSVSLKIKSDFVIMCTGYLNLRNIFKISRVNSNSFSISIYGSDAEPKFKNALS